MNALQIILNILLIIASLVMIVTVLLQSSDSDGMGAISGSTETFFGKAKNAALEAKLALATKISCRRVRRAGADHDFRRLIPLSGKSITGAACECPFFAYHLSE